MSATLTSEGAGTAGPISRGLSLAWTGSAPEPDATTTVPGLGTVRVRCDATRDGVRALLIDGAGSLAVTTYQGSESKQRLVVDAVPLPLNGLVDAVAPNGARLLVASRWKVDDPDPGANFCRIWGVVTVGG